MTKSNKITFAIICVFLILGIILFQTTRLNLNQTLSLDSKFFLTLKNTHFKKGDLITIRGHKTSYYKDVYFTKIVKGVAGDQITIKGQDIFINDQWIAKLKKFTLKGKPLTPLKAKLIPSGYIFLSAPHVDSFDSKYQEFGLIHINQVIGRVIWAW